MPQQFNSITVGIGQVIRVCKVVLMGSSWKEDTYISYLINLIRISEKFNTHCLVVLYEKRGASTSKEGITAHWKKTS